MSNLMNHVLMNKLDDELSEAIQSVGGDVSKAKGPWDYPEIIKAQLGVRSDSSLPSLDIKLGPGLKIEEINGVKYILATSGALTTCTLNPPTGSYLQPTSGVIEAGTPIQTVLESLFYEILPKMQSVYKGDIVIASNDGSDRYNEEDTRSGLIPNAHYMRLYVANRQEPIYVLLSGHGVVNNEIGNIPSQPSQPGTSQEYVGGTSQYIKVDVVGNVITASLNEEGAALFDKIITLEKTVEVHTNALNTVMNDVTGIKEALDLIGDVDLSGIGELNTKVNALDTKVNGLEAELAGKANQSDLDAIQDSINSIDLSKIEELDSKVNALDESMSSLEESINGIDLSGIGEVMDKVVELDVKVDNMDTKIESKVSQEEFESFKESVGDVDFSDINSRLDEVESNMDVLEDTVNNLDLGDVSGLSSRIDEVNAKVNEINTELETLASQEDLEEVQKTVTLVQETVVTRTEVETIVETQIQEVVLEPEFTDNVEQIIVNQITDATNVEVQEAITQIIENVVTTATEEQANSVVNDIFANK